MTETWNGQWWIPGEPNNKQPGILTRDDQNQLTLELVGGFKVDFYGAPGENGMSPHYEREEFPIIVGSTRDGKIALLECHAILSDGRNPFRGTDPTIQRIISDRALIGTHLSKPDEPAFRQLRLDIEYLLHFLNDPQELAQLEALGSTAKLSDVHGSPEFEYDGLNFRVTYEQCSFHERRASSRLDIIASVTPAIIITSNQPTSFGRLDKHTKSVLDLLTIATGRPRGCIRETLDENILDADSVTIVEKKIHNIDSKLEYKGSRGVRFTCADLPFDELLSGWLKLRKELGSAIDLLLGPVYNPHSYLQEKLLDIAAAAETFHTRKYNFKPRTDEDYAALIEVMTANVPDKETRDNITTRYTNSPSFAMRMVSLLEKPDATAVKLVIPDPDRWVDQIKKARNGLAHGSATKLPPLLDSQILMQQTTVLLILCIMHELGISEERQREVANDELLLSYRHRKEVLELAKTGGLYTSAEAAHRATTKKRRDSITV